MKSRSLTHVADLVLARDLANLAANDRTTTAALLEHIAEFDLRELYLPAACPSMFRYCVDRLRMSEDVAAKRIRAARAARRYPAILPAIAEGRLNVSAVVLLNRQLKQDNAAELLAAAEGRTNEEIKMLLAQRFPPPGIEAFTLLASGENAAARPLHEAALQQAVRPVAASSTPAVPTRFAVPAARAQVKPIAPGKYELQAVIGQATNDKLVRAKDLLGHAITAGDIADVLDRALTVLVATLEKRRCAATDRPRLGTRRRSANPRHVPAEVVRAVWERDGGQCAFVSDSGHRCPERMSLELDHIVPVARGGLSTRENVRLLCRAHNQFAAEREFGRPFMEGRREAARRAATEERMRREAAAKAAKARTAAAAEAAKVREAAAAALARQVEEVGPWLKGLGFNAAEARQAAARCVAIPDAPLEERVRVALRSLAPPGARRTAPVVSVPA